MSDIFNRPGRNVVKNYHVYTTDEKVLCNIGLASYTRNSIEKFGKERRNGSDVLRAEISEYFDGSFNQDTFLGDSSDLQILAFDKPNGRYLLQTSGGAGEESIWWSPSGNGAMAASNLEDFQTKFDLYQKGFMTDSTQKERIREVWSKIQTSLSGCITFKTDSYNVLSCNKQSLIKIYFQSAGKSKSSRNIAQKGAPMIAGTPRRATGGSWAYSSTQETAPGVYVPAREGGNNNPENTVAGEMRMSYDPTTGKWESGTQQMLFRLLTDIDGVPQKDLPKDVDSSDINDFYEGPFSSQFKVGIGMPVSVENGNPHMFGPNSYGCGPSKKEKVKMINRTPRAYSKGEIVIGSLINGEWIPMGFGPPRVVSKKLDIRWSQIQKFIVDAKSFFRNRSDTGDISPEEYADYIRIKFYGTLEQLSNASELAAYGNDLQRLAIINLLKPDLSKDPDPYEIDSNGRLILPNSDKSQTPNYNLYFGSNRYKPSFGYMQIFDADVIHTNLGGNNENSRLIKTNISKVIPDYQDDNYSIVFAKTVTANWGMYFNDGYTSSSVNKLKSRSGSVTSYFENLGLNTFPIYKSTTLNFAASNEGGNKLDVSDNYLYHIPAQLGLNSSGNPTPLAYLLWSFQEKTNFADSISKYAADEMPKGDWLMTPNSGSAYGLIPTDPTLVQFSPLSLELALCSTTIPTSDDRAPIIGGYRDLRLTLNSANWTSQDLGQAWTRLMMPENGYVLSSEGLNGFVKGKIGFGNSLFDLPDINGNGRLITRPNTQNYPDGGPQILPYYDSKEFSNVVGMIGARATVILTQGGQLELKTNNSFGLNSYGTVGGGGGSMDMTFLGSLGSWFTDNRGQTLKNEYVQWGNTEPDKIRAFGTTKLWCRAYDHCPNTIYDPRYFVPLQFNDSEKALDGSNIFITIPATGTGPTKVLLKPGDRLGKNSPTILTLRNPIRANMLLTGGGFYYIKLKLAADPSTIRILEGGAGYKDSDRIKFGSAIFKPILDGGGGITNLELVRELDENGQENGALADGDFAFNTFRLGHVPANFTNATGDGADIRLNGGIIKEKLMCDKLEYYGQNVLTPSDNDGNGDDGGYVRSSRTVNFNLAQNTTGKYDLYFLFINDILNHPENSIAATYMEIDPASQYVNLQISAN